MSQDLHTVIEVCDQVERNRLGQGITPTQDLAHRAHTVLQDQGLDVSLAECQHAVEQVKQPVVIPANTEAPVTGEAKVTEPLDASIRLGRPLLPELAPVMAAGAFWGFIHGLAQLQPVAPGGSVAAGSFVKLLQSLNAGCDHLMGWAFFFILGRALFRLARNDPNA